jgi:hypothetical protein
MGLWLVAISQFGWRSNSGNLPAPSLFLKTTLFDFYVDV